MLGLVCEDEDEDEDEDLDEPQKRAGSERPEPGPKWQ